MSVEPHRGHWLAEVLPGEEDSPILIGDERADIVIVGGGFTGLWTALRIKEHDPACDVVLLERDVCGGAASGRNGGFVMPWWPKLASLVKYFGREDGVALARASEAVVGELAEFLEANSIDASMRRKGWIWTATSQAQLGAWEPVMEVCEEAGVEPFRRLSSEEVAARTGSDTHLAGVYEPAAAVLQPAAVARGLRRVAIERGVRIFEHTHVRRIRRRRPATVTTAGGRVRAEKVVIATNAWAANLVELHTSMVVVGSAMVVTPPIPERLAQIGWLGGEGVTDSQDLVDYYRTTADGRIAFGKAGSGTALAGRIGTSFDRNLRYSRWVADEFRRCYPALRDVPIADSWGGPVDRTPDGLPIVGHLGGREHLIYGLGFSGNGVGPSMFVAKTLAALALDIDDEWSRSPLVDRRRAHFPPEPARIIGAGVVRRAVASKEHSENLGKQPRRIDLLLANLAPAGAQGKRAQDPETYGPGG